MADPRARSTLEADVEKAADTPEKKKQLDDRRKNKQGFSRIEQRLADVFWARHPNFGEWKDIGGAPSKEDLDNPDKVASLSSSFDRYSKDSGYYRRKPKSPCDIRYDVVETKDGGGYVMAKPLRAMGGNKVKSYGEAIDFLASQGKGQIDPQFGERISNVELLMELRHVINAALKSKPPMEVNIDNNPNVKRALDGVNSWYRKKMLKRIQSTKDARADAMRDVKLDDAAEKGVDKGAEKAVDKSQEYRDMEERLANRDGVSVREEMSRDPELSEADAQARQEEHQKEIRDDIQYQEIESPGLGEEEGDLEARSFEDQMAEITARMDALERRENSLNRDTDQLASDQVRIGNTLDGNDADAKNQAADTLDASAGLLGINEDGTASPGDGAIAYESEKISSERSALQERLEDLTHDAHPSEVATASNQQAIQSLQGRFDDQKTRMDDKYGSDANSDLSKLQKAAADNVTKANEFKADDTPQHRM